MPTKQYNKNICMNRLKHIWKIQMNETDVYKMIHKTCLITHRVQSSFFSLNIESWRDKHVFSDWKFTTQNYVASFHNYAHIFCRTGAKKRKYYNMDWSRNLSIPGPRHNTVH